MQISKTDIYISICMAIMIVLSSCNKTLDKHERHYAENYNFVVSSDSLVLIKQVPEETVGDFILDSVAIPLHTLLVVAEIRIIPNGDNDSVWVQLASDQLKTGWIQESKMLPNVVPDDPISNFISLFSNTHLIIFLMTIIVIASGYGLSLLMKKKTFIVHFNDIDSYYPTLLTILMALAASFYATIQHFAPESWEHFYFHPSLNPFTQSPLLMCFLLTLWLMLITAIAAIDDTLRCLPLQDAFLYLCGLGAVCAIDYVVFSVTTLYYIGYIFLIAYIFFAIKRKL